MKAFARCFVALVLSAAPLSGLAQQYYSHVGVTRAVKLRILPGKTKEFFEAFAYAPKVFEAEKAAGIITSIGCHTFRATGITVYLLNGGLLEYAQQMAAHESARTTKLYDRRNDQVTLDQVERIIL